MLASDVRLLADLNTDPLEPKDAVEAAPFQGGIVFVAEIESGRDSLWFTSPEAGAIRLFDFSDRSGALRQLTVAGDLLYFVTSTDALGDELYRTDGTAAGTWLLRDINPGPNGADVEQLTAVGSTLFFSARQDPMGRELWKTDGTSDGTQLVRDIHPDGDSNPTSLAEFGGRLYFSAIEQTLGAGLWVSDGTAAGTELVRDVRDDFFSQEGPEQLTVVGDLLFFVALDRNTHRLWVSDGETSGTKPLRGFGEFNRPDELTSFAGKLYFRAGHTGGIELWTSDGTLAGTTQFADIVAGPEGSYPHQLVASDLHLFFRAQTDETGAELWRTDGTVAGTQFVRDFNRGVGSSEFSEMTAVGDRLYFRLQTHNQPDPLWVSDGTPEGTRRLSNSRTNRNPKLLTSSDDALYYHATTEDRSGFWKIAADTDVPEFLGGAYQSTASSNLGESALAGNHYFFELDDDLWVTDTQTLETRKLVGRDGGFDVVGSLVSSGGYLYFIGDDGEHGAELWRSDGTIQGTAMVRDINNVLPNAQSLIFDLQPFRNGVVFTAYRSDMRSLWVSFGTEATTVQLTDLALDGGRAQVGVTDDQIYFGLNVQRESWLWTSDGSVQGTRPVKLIGDVYVAAPQDFTRSGAYTFFHTDTRTYGRELWKTDGTEAGTMLVRDIHPEFGNGSTPKHLVDLKGVLLFSASSDHPAERELWRSDGTAEGTIRIPLPVDRTHDLDPAWFTPFAGRVYFVAAHPQFGREVWVTDGTASGTKVLLDIEPGSAGSDPVSLTVVNGFLHFKVRASGPVGVEHGWISDGTPEGTRRFVPDSDIEVVRQPIGDGKSVFFQGSDAQYGLEPRVFQPRSGDANYDGRTDFSDFLILSSHFGRSGTWAEGDFDGNGGIEFADFLLLSASFERETDAVAEGLSAGRVDRAFAQTVTWP